MSRTHVLTGAGSGIGRALAEKLRDRGDRLVLVLRSEARADDLRPDFPDARLLVADLTDPGSLHGVGRELDGDVDALVHVAGVVDLSPVAAFRLDEWQRQLDVNLTSPAVLTRELLPHLRRSRGRVVFVNSGAGLRANPTWAGYAASKFGLRALADALRIEEAEHGVRVSSVFPSRTATAMQATVHEQEGRAYDEAAWIRPESVADAIVTCLDVTDDASIPDLTVGTAPG